MVHPGLRDVERVDLHMLHHADKAMLGRFLGGDVAELHNEMRHKRADVS